MFNPTAEWNQLHDKFYRKREVYSMLWQNMDLSKYNLVGAPYGGPLALIRDEKKLVLVNNSSLRPMIHIASSSGKDISSFLWERGKLVGMGWTENEKLVCVVSDGTVLIYSIYGEILSQFSMGKECKEKGVIDCKIWGSGVVCITGDFQVIAVTNLAEPRSKKLANTGLTSPPVSWTFIEPQYSLSSNLEVLLAPPSGTVLLVDVDSASVHDQLLLNGPFTKMSVSPNGKLLACFTETGVLWVVTSDFSKNLSQFDTKSKVPPEQMSWCGTDSVVLYWDRILLVVGPYGDWIKYSYEEPLYLIPECDGVRIITNEKCEFLQKVPDVTEQIFKIGSTAPAAMLYDAMDHFEKKSPKADENIRSIKNELAAAVTACIEAAGHEFSHSLQRSLLKAASFGKCFLDFYDPTAFVEMCKTLRVLNAVNHYEIGIPITYQQFKQLRAAGLVDRLINRHEHLLAWRICEFLKMKKDRVLVHWACVKVKTSATDNELSEIIVQKLANVPGISYAEIASTAYKAGRLELATRLLDYEPRAADQVPLLISMQQEELALSKAIESGDTDLVYLVVLHIKRNRSPIEFFRIIRNKPVALDLLISYCKQQDLKLLKDLYYQFDQPQETANITVLEAYTRNGLDERITGLQEALQLYTESKDAFAAKATEEQIKLLLLQKDLETSLGGQFVDTSLSDTLSKLIILGQSKRASKIKSDFKVPDKRYWWIKIKALAQIKDWVSLEKFAKEKKSPIGYAPFAALCIEAGALREAEKYIPKIQDPIEKIDFYVRIGNFMEAVEVARTQKDPNLLISIKNKCTNKEALQYIDQLLNSMATQR